MTDIQNAKYKLNTDDLTLCVVKNKQLIFESKERGILPLYLAYSQDISFVGCACADRIIGLGAAYFYTVMQAKCLYAQVISSSAYQYLVDHDIDVSCEKKVGNIMNREKNGFCPIETLAKSYEDFDEFIQRVQDFLKQFQLI